MRLQHVREDGGSSPESTIHLILRARAGDREALERLFGRHAVPLRHWARGRLPRWARQLSDTNDLVQDALLQTFRRIDTFEPRGVGRSRPTLRPEDRDAIIGRLEVGYSYEELARILGKPTADAARKAARRALMRLAEELRRGRD